MSNKDLVIIGCIIFITNLFGCTSYVKPSSLELNAIRNPSVIVEGNPNFSHIGAIADESFWGTMLLSPLFMGIIDTAIDIKTAESISRKEVASHYRSKFISAISDDLQEQKSLGHFDSISVNENTRNQDKTNADATILLNITEWGTRTRKPGSDRIIPYMEIKIIVTRVSDKKLILEEKRIVAYDARHTLEDYKQQQGLFDNDFTKLTTKAAKQMTALFSKP